MKDLFQHIHEKLVLKKDYETIFKSKDPVIREAANNVLAHLMKTAGIPKVAASINPNELLVQEGAQRIVYTIFRVLNTDPQTLQEQIAAQYNED